MSDDTQMKIRLPLEMAQEIAASAILNRRSINGEILHRLDQYIAPEGDLVRVLRDAIRNPVQPADPPRGDNISPSPLGDAGNDDFKRVQVIGSIE
jgi:hypothetical protein